VDALRDGSGGPYKKKKEKKAVVNEIVTKLPFMLLQMFSPNLFKCLIIDASQLMRHN
jgi:hypothetical protein